MNQNRFKLKYAPHFGMFKESAGEDLCDQLKFGADQGFRAWEDNGMGKRDVSTQTKVALEMQRLGLEMGVFVATASFEQVTFAGTDQALRQKVLDDLKAAVEIAQRVHAKWCTVVPGLYDLKLAWGYQTANCIELLRRCCEICEKSGLVMVLEPLNRLQSHPRVFLATSPETYALCKAVNHPCCKILFDCYHQQITEGNLIPNIDQSWDEIAYFQCGDNPGRKEPTTGEINYRNVFKHILGKSPDPIMGLEHGNSRPGMDGEQAVLQAYRACDDF